MELVFELMKRPHLYSINCEGKMPEIFFLPFFTHGLQRQVEYIYSDGLSTASVSLLNRELIDRLLKCLDTRAQWTIGTLIIALGEGKAGEEWKGQFTIRVDTVT